MHHRNPIGALFMYLYQEQHPVKTCFESGVDILFLRSKVWHAISSGTEKPLKTEMVHRKSPKELKKLPEEFTNGFFRIKKIQPGIEIT